MAIYMIRRVRFDDWGNPRPVQKRTSRHVTPLRLELGGVYSIRGRMYRVERVL